MQCQYCHVTVEKSSYAGIPPTKTCMNCHAQIWTNAQLLEPVRQSWLTGQSLPWIKVHDLPDYVYFSHEIHVNKGIGCASCHGRVDQMPLMYAQNTLQMEWCLDCHRKPAKNLQPTSEIYNKAWESPSERPAGVVRGGRRKDGVPTAASVNCGTKEPAKGVEVARCIADGAEAGRDRRGRVRRAGYNKFTSQDELGHFLLDHYKIRTPKDLASCEVCHR